MGAEHKGPLAAFVVVAVVAAILLVTSVRSQAATHWLTRGLPAVAVAVVTPPAASTTEVIDAVGDRLGQAVDAVTPGATTAAEAPTATRVARTKTRHPAPTGGRHEGHGPLGVQREHEAARGGDEGDDEGGDPGDGRNRSGHRGGSGPHAGTPAHHGHGHHGGWSRGPAGPLARGHGHAFGLGQGRGRGRPHAWTHGHGRHLGWSRHHEHGARAH